MEIILKFIHLFDNMVCGTLEYPCIYRIFSISLHCLKISCLYITVLFLLLSVQFTLALLLDFFFNPRCYIAITLFSCTVSVLSILVSLCFVLLFSRERIIVACSSHRDIYKFCIYFHSVLFFSFFLLIAS